jgi:hypothetical protein
MFRPSQFGSCRLNGHARLCVNWRLLARLADNVRQAPKFLGCKSPWMKAVSADEVRQLDQKLSKPGILLKQRLSFVGTFVTTIRRSIPFKGISK